MPTFSFPTLWIPGLNDIVTLVDVDEVLELVDEVVPVFDVEVLEVLLVEDDVDVELVEVELVEDVDDVEEVELVEVDDVEVELVLLEVLDVEVELVELVETDVLEVLVELVDVLEVEVDVDVVVDEVSIEQRNGISKVVFGYHVPLLIKKVTPDMPFHEVLPESIIDSFTPTW